MQIIEEIFRFFGALLADLGATWGCSCKVHDPWTRDGEYSPETEATTPFLAPLWPVFEMHVLREVTTDKGATKRWQIEWLPPSGLQACLGGAGNG